MPGAFALFGALLPYWAVVVATEPPPTGEARDPVLTVDACLTARVTDIERAFAVELGRRFGDVSHDDRTAPRFALGCAGEQVVISVATVDGSRAFTRTLDLSSTPPRGHARLVAIAAVELAAPLWSSPPIERGPASDAAPAPVASVAAAVARQPDPPRPVVTLSVFGDTRMFVGDAALLTGGGLGIAIAGDGRWSAGTDVVMNWGSRTLASGRATTVLISARPSLAAHWRARSLSLSASAGVRAGAAHLAGEPGEPDVVGATLWGIWGGPSLIGAASLAMSRSVAVSAGFEVGWAAGDIVGRDSGVRALSIGGGWIGGQLGLVLLR